MWWILLSLLGSVFFLSNVYNPLPSLQSSSEIRACRPNLEVNEWIKVDVDSEKETFPDGRPLYKEKEDKLWVLIKRDAPIPAWKVWGGAGKERDGLMIAEMEKIGSVSEAVTSSFAGKEVFVGVGHCNGNPQESCLDPLVQDALFVPTQEGVRPPLPYCMTHWPDAKSEQCMKEAGYWWALNVYIDASILPANPTYDNLPCWAKLACGKGDVMGENRKKVWEEFLKTGVCNADLKVNQDMFGNELDKMAALSIGENPPSFIQKDNITFTAPDFDKNKLDQVYWYEREVSVDPGSLGAIVLGTYSYQSSQFEISYLESGGVLFASFLPEKIKYYSYAPLVKVVKPDAKSLQLGTFSPQKKFDYEWWTPACKPAIYLYPEKATELSVKVKPKGKITVSIPEHGEEGWKVVAYPDGTLLLPSSTVRGVPSGHLGGGTYPYLYYEAELEQIKIADNGWIVKKDEIEPFFNDVLPRLGLNSQEQQDFLDYWLPKLEKYLSKDKETMFPRSTVRGVPPLSLRATVGGGTQANNQQSPQRRDSSQQLFIGLIDREELDRVEPIEFSPQPDTFIRVRFYFEMLTRSLGYTPKPADLPKEVIRDGFTAVDWGGILENGSCGAGEISEY